MQREYAYLAVLEPDESGALIVGFPAIREAHTSGADRAEALAEAQDCLEAVLFFRLKHGEAVPKPHAGRIPPNGVLLRPSTVMAHKLALHEAMRAKRVSQGALAKRLKLDEKEVRRLLDPKHQSKIGRLEAALAVLGAGPARAIFDLPDAA